MKAEIPVSTLDYIKNLSEDELEKLGIKIIGANTYFGDLYAVDGKQGVTFTYSYWGLKVIANPTTLEYQKVVMKCLRAVVLAFDVMYEGSTSKSAYRMLASKDEREIMDKEYHQVLDKYKNLEDLLLSNGKKP